MKEEDGGENWRRNMEVSSWRTRAVLPEITLLSVCLDHLLALFVPPIALAMYLEPRFVLV